MDEVWLKHAKKKVKVLSHVKIEGINLCAVDYKTDDPTYHGIIHFRPKSDLNLNDFGVPKWAEAPCPTFCECGFYPYMGMCFEQCSRCIMQKVYRNYYFRQKRLAIFKEVALIDCYLPKEPKTFYAQSSFEAFHPLAPEWMTNLIFDKILENDIHYWLFHTRAPETFVKRILKGLPMPKHHIIGVSLETDHDVKGFSRSSSIDERLKNIRILTKELNADLFVSIAPFYAPKDIKGFVRKLSQAGVTKIAICCDQLSVNSVVNQQAAHDMIEETNKQNIITYVNSYSFRKWGLDHVAPGKLDFVTFGDPRRAKYFDIK